MASVFTYDPDPPRISSPWPVIPRTPAAAPDAPTEQHEVGGLPAPPPTRLADLGTQKLEPEPQSGPIEYKVHLLLRPRRALAACSTGPRVSGSHASGRPSPAPGQQRPTGTPREKGGAQEDASLLASEVPVSASPLPVPSLQARQNRLQHLTTQLLWRLQQSSPFHASAAAPPVLPMLPDVGTLEGSGAVSAPTPPGRPASLLFPGLAESRGALYEIGVADDGGLVGLARDEMDDSVATLRVMATNLGCSVEIRRVVEVGNCAWQEPVAPVPLADDSTTDAVTSSWLHVEPLWVVEAFVTLDTSVASGASGSQHTFRPATSAERWTHASNGGDMAPPDDDGPQTEQLRVALTGATAAGKSSLLGTLSTSTLDNGRGKSRLSLLKHHHEIRSGLTSSIAPELLGYRPCRPETADPDGSFDDATNVVVNYGLANVSSWNDIHHEAAGGRLILWTDSGGHQKYKRTLVRSLVSWAPHWVACCVAADASASAIDGGIDLSKAHMDLCLHLGLPLLIVVTKMDTATASLRTNLADILATLRERGRTPVVMPLGKRITYDGELQAISAEDSEEIQVKLEQASAGGQHKLVPVILTSAVTGANVGKLHALLRELPLPVHDASAGGPCRFHVDEVFVRADSELGRDDGATAPTVSEHPVIVLSGILRNGRLSIGDNLLLGPFTPEQAPLPPHSEMAVHRARSYPARLGTSPSARSHIRRPTLQDPRRRSGDLPQVWSKDEDDRPTTNFADEWLSVRILSIRNLRLPQRKLLADQAGTIGIAVPGDAAAAAAKLRKGMVLIDQYPGSVPGSKEGAASGFRALFAERDYRVMEPGAQFVVCVASVRARAKISTVEAVGDSSHRDDPSVRQGTHESALFEFEMPENGNTLDAVAGQERSGAPGQIEVAFRFVEPREWVATGATVLVMPCNVVEGSVGLDAFVGRVTAIEP